MSRRNSIHRRLGELEERTFGADPFRDFPDWGIVDQLEAVAETLRWYKVFHADGVPQYPATDRELHLLGLLCALWELGGPPPPEEGEHRFPSGLRVTWHDHGDGTWSTSATGYLGLEDLPEWVRKHFKRMDPLEQPERER